MARDFESFSQHVEQHGKPNYLIGIDYDGWITKLSPAQEIGHMAVKFVVDAVKIALQSGSNVALERRKAIITSILSRGHISDDALDALNYLKEEVARFKDKGIIVETALISERPEFTIPDSQIPGIDHYFFNPLGKNPLHRKRDVSRFLTRLGIPHSQHDNEIEAIRDTHFEGADGFLLDGIMAFGRTPKGVHRVPSQTQSLIKNFSLIS